MIAQVARIALFSILISLAAIAQISAILVWPGFFGEVNLVLIILAILLFFRGLKPALIAAIISGFWLDLFSFNLFGSNTFSFLAAILIADKISLTWLTNRSFYSFLIINIITVLSFNFFSGLLFYFSNFEASGFFIFRSSFWLSVAYQSIWSLIASFLTFNLSLLVTKKLEPVFLETGFLEKK